MFKKIFKSKWFLPVILSVVLVVTGIIGVFIAGNTDAYFTDNDKGNAAGDSGKTGVSFIVGENSFAETLDGVDEIDTMYWAGAGKLNFTIQNNEDIALDAYTTILFTSEDEHDWESIAPLIELYDQKYVTIENDNYILSDDAVPVKATKEVLDNGIQWTLAKDVISGSDEAENGQIRWINSEGNAISNAKYQSLTDQEKAAYTKCEDAKTYDLFFCYHESGGADIRMEVTVHSSTNKEGNQLGWKRSNEFKRYGHLMPRVNILEAGELFTAHLTELAKEEEVKEVVFTASDLSDKAAVEPVATYSLRNSAPAATTMSLRSGGEEEKVLPVCPGVTIPSEGTIDVSHYKNKSILAWNDNGTVYVASANGDVVYANWDCSKMFKGQDTIEKIRFVNFDITEYTNDMSGMFYDADALKMLDLSKWDTTNITKMDEMFNSHVAYGYAASNISAIYVSDLWNTENVTSSTAMGHGMPNLIGQSGFKKPGGQYDDPITLDEFNYKTGAMVYYDGSPNTLVAGHHFRDLTPSNVTEVYFGDYHENIPSDKSQWIDFSISQDYAIVGWVDGTKLYVTTQDGSVIKTCGSMYKMFSYESSWSGAVTKVVFDNIDDSMTFNAGSLFYNQGSLKEVDFGPLKLANANNLSYMFYECRVLEQMDLTYLDTTKVEDISYMFYNCRALKKLQLNGMDTTSVTNMSYVFGYCQSLKMLDLSTWDTSKVINMDRMFCGSVGYSGVAIPVNTIYVSDLWDTSNVTSAEEMGRSLPYLVGQSGYANTAGQYEPAVTLEEFNYKTGVLTYYDGAPNTIVAGPNFNALMSSVSEVYIGDYHESIPADTTIWIDFSIAQDYSVLGWKDGSKLYITTQDGSKINTCGSMYRMFNYANSSTLTKVVLNNIDTANTFNFAEMFYNQSSLTSVDIDVLNTKNADNMSKMFYNCQKIAKLDLSKLDTSNVEDMNNMFYYCRALTNLNVTGWNTAKVTNMSNMFGYCQSLQMLNLSTWDTSNVTNMDRMFNGSSGYSSVNVPIRAIYVSDLWNTDNVDPSTVVTNYFPYLTGQSGYKNMSNSVTVEELNYETGLLTYYDGSPNTIFAGPHFNSLYNSSIVRFGDYHESIPADESTWIDFSIAQDKSVIGWRSGSTLYITTQDGSPIKTCGSMYQMFSRENSSAYSVTEVTFDNLDTSNTFNFARMFYNQTALATLNMSGLNTQSADNMSYMFYQCSKLDKLDVSSFVTDNVKDMSHMFYYCQRITSLDLSNWNLANVMSFERMFYDCRSMNSLTFKDNLDTSSATNMAYMFYDCYQMKAFNVADFDTQNVTDMSYMFASCSNSSFTTLDLSTWNFSKVQNFQSMFSSCSYLAEIKFGDVDTSSATNMSYMFYQCNRLKTVNLAAFDTGNVKNMDYMFYYCYTIPSLDLSTWDFSKVESMNYMFYYCSGIKELNLGNIDTSNVKSMNYTFYSLSGLTELDVSKLDTQNVTSMQYMFYGLRIKELDVSALDVSKVTNMSYMFAYNYGLTELDLSTWQVNSALNTSYMFQSCTELRTIYAGDWTGCTGGSTRMFEGAQYLVGDGCAYTSDYIDKTMASQAGYFSAKPEETANMTMPGYKLNAIIPSSVNTVIFTDTVPNGAATTDLSALGDGSVVGWTEGSTYYISTTDGSKVIAHQNFSSAFKDKSNLVTVDLTNLDTSKVKNMGYMFYGCSSLTTVNTEVLDTTNVIATPYMFYNCARLVSVDTTGWNMAKNASTSRMFYNCSKLQEIVGINDWDVSNLGDASYMFYGCKAITTLDLSGWNLNKVQSLTQMFYNCTGLLSLDLSGWNISTAKDTSSMFSGCTKLAVIYAGDWSTSFTPSRNGSEFYNCSSLPGYSSSYGWSKANTQTGFFTDKSTITANMLVSGKILNSQIPSSATSVVFTDAVAGGVTTTDLSALNDGSVVGWLDGTTYYISTVDGSKVIANPVMYQAFYNKNKLVSIDFTNLDTSKVTNMSQMFYGCTSLTTFDASKLDVSNVTNMYYMFYNCIKLTELDLSSWNTSKVTDVSYMFYYCTGLTTLDLTGWDVSSITNAYGMFYYCSNLTTIYGDNWTAATTPSNSNSMFYYCNKLVGATSYNSSYTNWSMANADTGYFTVKPAVFSEDLIEEATEEQVEASDE